MSAAPDRYAGRDDAFDEQHGVLRNKLGITDPEELEDVIAEQLAHAYELSLQRYSDTHRFTQWDVCTLHRLFLGDIFSWAGQYRNVDMVSDDIHWCRALFVKQEMSRFDALLAELTPFSPALTRDELVERMAGIHGELILIHPFRDGNGRTARLLCDLLLVQAGRETIHHAFTEDSENRPDYLQAIRTLHFQDDLRLLVAFFDRFL